MSSSIHCSDRPGPPLSSAKRRVARSRNDWKLPGRQPLRL